MRFVEETVTAVLLGVLVVGGHVLVTGRRATPLRARVGAVPTALAPIIAPASESDATLTGPDLARQDAHAEAPAAGGDDDPFSMCGSCGCWSP